MTEPFVSVREFDGAMNSLREDFRRVESKCDQIIAAKAEEARQIGEFCGRMDSILAQVKRAEKDSQENRGLIADIRKDMERQDQGRLKWWGQFLLVAASVGMTWLATRLVK